MLWIKLRVCCQIVKNKYKLTSFPRLHTNCLRQALIKHFVPIVTNQFGPMFFSSTLLKTWKTLRFLKFLGVREKKHWFHKQTVTHIFSLKSNGSTWGYNLDFMFIMTHKITEDNLTYLLHTFSNNIAVTFSEVYYCIHSNRKRGLIKQKLEIAASHHPWRSNSKLFFKLSLLQKMFGKTSFEKSLKTG